VLIKAVEVLTRTDDYDVVKVTTEIGGLEKIYVISGEVVEKTKTTLTLKLISNDSLLLRKRTVLWWNRETEKFER